MKDESVQIADCFKLVRRAAKQLDQTNIKILSNMWKFGPRNLLEISRRTGIPFTSVYHRVGKLEAKSGGVVRVIPQIAKLGMRRLVVLVNARAGEEERVQSALKIPNFWWSINPCESPFTFHSVHAVPAKYLTEFSTYIKELHDIGLINEFRMIRTGEQFPNFPDFQYYDPKTNCWTLPWGSWLKELGQIHPRRIRDPTGYATLADKRDLLIVKELEKNARKSFAELAPVLGVSLQAVRYRYEKRLVPRLIVNNLDFDVYPYPVEMSAYHEIMLEFPGKDAMDKFFSLVSQLFFVLAGSEVLGRTALMVRTFILESQLLNMFKFFSEMANNRMLDSYSPVRLRLQGREMQTISYELFDDEIGWSFDLKRRMSELHELAKHSPLLPARKMHARRR
jgi:DNA-binding Lrp family transcriptional regulator